ncbi:MAG: methyl viologen-reducing hydrogenase [Desulfosarcinaceae bacterium]|nr:methyl viologen-reducing hydrogenase [Desulfosarcinaceae bacterium]
MTVSVASEWLNACSGCEIAIVDMGERLLKILELVEFVHIPVLMDNKYYGQTGERHQLRLPAADVGIISGGVRNEEHLEVAEEMRRQCQTIIALGTCATHGGIPALSNSYANDQIVDRYYHTESTDPTQELPHDGVPALLEGCKALDEVIPVDVYLPGCPPHPDQVFGALAALLDGAPLPLRDKSVCDTCPTSREGKGRLAQMRRFLHAPKYGAADEPLDKMRCLLEQGLLCMGPVTRAGCGGDAALPRCIKARVPCRGCYGPAKPDGNQRMEMLGALASNGIDITSLPESTSLLRFSGAHGRLRPPLVRK